MITAAELAAMRTTQETAHPGTAYIRRRTLAADGMGGWTETWANVGTVTARWGQNTMAGRESVMGAQITSHNDWTISVPFDADVQAKDQVAQVGSDKLWEVIFVPNGQSHQTAIYLKAELLNEETT